MYYSSRGGVGKKNIGGAGCQPPPSLRKSLSQKNFFVLTACLYIQTAIFEHIYFLQINFMPAAGKKIRDLIMTLLTSTSQNVQFWAIVGARVKGQRPELGRLCLLLPWGPNVALDPGWNFFTHVGQLGQFQGLNRFDPRNGNPFQFGD